MFIMVAQVFEVRENGVPALFYNGFHNHCFVVWFSFTLNNLNGSLWAMAKASPQAVAKQVAYQAGFAINDL